MAHHIVRSRWVWSEWSADALQLRYKYGLMPKRGAAASHRSALASFSRSSVSQFPALMVRDYLTALERIMIIEDQPAWAPPLRSRSRIRRAATRHFVDPSLAAAALRATLGPGQIDAAAAALLTFASRVDTARCGAPAALGVITVAGYGYQRPDGVHVIPIAALGP